MFFFIKTLIPLLIITLYQDKYSNMKKNQFALEHIKKICFKSLISGLLLISWVNMSCSGEQPATAYFDMGNDTSAVWEGFTRVTPANVFTPGSGFGWQSGDGLNAQALAYPKRTFNPIEKTEDVPPIWTNPITEDAIISDRENTFLFKAAPGDYEIYIVCGTSAPSRNQYFDFTIQIGSEKQRVQFEGGYNFHSQRFHAKSGDDPIAVRFTPRSKWTVNAIIAWPVTKTSEVEKEIITPFEEWTYRLKPEEWVKWKLDSLPPAIEPQVSESDEKRGFVVYSRPYLECIYPKTTPRTEDLNPLLQIFATPGEFEPVNFIIYPLKNLSNAKVTISDIGPIPAKNIEIRHVRFMRARTNYTTRYLYRIVPDLLEQFTSLDLAARENARFWLTVHIPEGATPGVFSGNITFECSDGKVELPISVRILPFKLLDDPGKLYAIYYQHPLDKMTGADEVSREYFRRKAELEHADMVAHGIRNVTMSSGGQAADANGNFKFDWDLMVEKFALWKKYGFRGPVVMSVNTGAIYEKYMKERYGSHLLNVKRPPEEFSRELTAMVKTMETERKKRGWPEFLYYPVDEPDVDSASVNFMLTVLKACKAAGVRTYFTPDDAVKPFEVLRPYADVWCMQPFMPDRETVVADMKTNKIEWWCYPNHVNGENDHTPVTGARMTYGFGFWRSGFVALIPWIYSASSGDRFNYLDGRSMDFFNRFEDDGTPIPVTLWEGYREGYDDYRYVYTLEQTIANTKKTGNASAKNKVAAAELVLKNIWDAIKVQQKYKYDGLWLPSDFDLHRWQIAQQIMDLQELLKK
jgi:hypothetical protein